MRHIELARPNGSSGQGTGHLSALSQHRFSEIAVHAGASNIYHNKQYIINSDANYIRHALRI